MSFSERYAPRRSLPAYLSLLLLIVGQSVLADNEKEGEPIDEAADPNLLANGSFEHGRSLRANDRAIPRDWAIRFSDRFDSFRHVTEPAAAHSGRRYLRLASPKGDGIRLDALPGDKEVSYEPGKTYEILLWARREGNEPAELTVDPGRERIEPSETWTEYRIPWTMPPDAEPGLGLVIRVRGGAVAVDDVAVVPDGMSPARPSRALSPLDSIAEIPHGKGWRTVDGERRWKQRVPIHVRERMGIDSRRYVLRMPLRDLLPEYNRYKTWRASPIERLTPNDLVVVDAADPDGEPVPWVVVDSDRAVGPTMDDELVFLVKCPARAQKTYHAYVSDLSARPPGSSATFPSSIERRELAMPADYPHEMIVDIGPNEPRVAVAARARDGGLELEVTGRTADSASAVISGPEGSPELNVPLVPAKDRDGVWIADGFALPKGAPDGVWRVRATVPGTNSADEVVEAGFTVGRALWWRSNAGKILPSDTPRLGAGIARIGAAGNERESFQIALASESDWTDVSLTGTGLIHEGGAGEIGGDAVTFDYVMSLWLPREGVTLPDPLVPWRTRTIRAGTHEVAWVTVRVPPAAAPGRYWGEIVAASPEGSTRSIPLSVEVWDFSLPDQLQYNLFLGGDIWEKITKGYHRRADGANPYTDLHTGEASLALARMFAEHHAIPSVYHHDKSFFAIPWHYEPDTGEATFDFERFDRNVEIYFEELGMPILMLGGKFAALWRRYGKVSDWSRDTELAWTGWWEEAVHEHLFSLNTDEGKKMFRAYLRGVADHLDEKGWIDKVCFYLVDEDKTDEVRQSCAEIARLIKDVDSRLGVLAVSNAKFRWPDYLEWTDHFSGHMADENRERFREQGGNYIGVYNGGGLIPEPLSRTRVLGAGSFLAGSTGYLNWATWRNPDMLIEGNSYYIQGPNAGYSKGEFIRSFHYGDLGTWIYCRPAWEPVDPAAKQQLFISSIRMQAVRESAEDYEYLLRLEQLAARQKPDAQGFVPAESLLAQLGKLMDRGRLKNIPRGWDDAKFTFYEVDPEAYYSLRMDIGRQLESAEE
jgi:hypothetical protein